MFFVCVLKNAPFIAHIDIDSNLIATSAKEPNKQSALGPDKFPIVFWLCTIECFSPVLVEFIDTICK